MCLHHFNLGMCFGGDNFLYHPGGIPRIDCSRISSMADYLECPSAPNTLWRNGGCLSIACGMHPPGSNAQSSGFAVHNWRYQRSELCRIPYAGGVPSVLPGFARCRNHWFLCNHHVDLYPLLSERRQPCEDDTFRYGGICRIWGVQRHHPHLFL